VGDLVCGNQHFKGTVAPDFEGLFWPAWIGLAEKRNLY